MDFQFRYRVVVHFELHLLKYCFSCSFPWIYDPFYPDIFVFKWVMTFRMLRNFGHLISHVHWDVCLYSRRLVLLNYISQYLLEYCSESLTHLSLYNSMGYCINDLFQGSDIQFVNMKTLIIQHCWEAKFTFFDKFPNLEFLKLNQNYSEVHPLNFLKVHYPSLKHLYFNEILHISNNGNYSLRPNYRKHQTLEKYLKEFLTLNPHIEKLELIMWEEWNPSFFLWLSDNLPQLKQLNLNCLYQDPSPSAIQPLHFPNVESFTFFHGFYNSEAYPFSFKKLNHFKVNRKEMKQSANVILDFIRKNQSLTSIELELNTDVDIFQLFEFEQVLFNVVELSIEKTDVNIPADGLMRFLQRNTSLKSISIIMEYNFYFMDFIHLIVEGDFGAKMRNNVLEFTIKRLTDGSMMKYLMGYTKVPVKTNYRKQIKYERFFEFCTRETPKFVEKDGRERSLSVDNLAKKYLMNSKYL